MSMPGDMSKQCFCPGLKTRDNIAMPIATIVAPPANSIMARACDALESLPPEGQAIVAATLGGFALLGVFATVFVGFAKTELTWRAWNALSRWIDGKQRIGFKP
jgi:hypothetical protein